MLLFIDCSQTMCEGKKYIISGAHAFIRVAFIADFSLARVAAPNNPSAKRADDNRLYKTTLPPDMNCLPFLGHEKWEAAQKGVVLILEEFADSVDFGL